MGSRRRNAFIIALVLALLAASAVVIASKPTVLGLDLKGGTQLVYEARGTPQAPNPTADDIERAINIIRTRTDKFGVAEPEISRLGEKGIQVGLPNVQNAEQAIAQVGKTAQLYFYDLEANIVPPPKKGVPKDPPNSPDPNPNVYTFPNLWSAVKLRLRAKAQGRRHHHGAHLLPLRCQVARAAGGSGREEGGPLPPDPATASSRPDR